MAPVNRHPDVPRISFTGSTEVGKVVAAVLGALSSGFVTT